MTAIESRRRKGAGTAVEYWLSVPSESGFKYHGWYTFAEMAEEIEECTISVETVRSRVLKANNGSSDFKTLWDVITIPARHAKDRKNKDDTDWNLLDQLWRMPA